MPESEPHASSRQILELGGGPQSRRAWLREVWAHREVLDILARKDFQTRYKRASFGLIWAVALPLLQAVVLAMVFSRVIRVGTGSHFALYVMSGVIAYAYFSTVVTNATTAIVDGAGLTDKVWFPRAVLILVPSLSNLPGLGVTIIVLLVSIPVFGVGLGPRALLLIPATALLFTFALALGLVLGALDVYFRDVKFLVQAALVVWIYLTPVLYPQHLLGGIGPWLDANPLTGVVTMFHLATVGAGGPWVRPVLVAVVDTAILLVAGLEAHRHHDRLFVDQL